MNKKIVITADGSHTLFDNEINENYHSTFGAVNESTHIFINAGLKVLPKSKKQIPVLEIGFGTGLNALLSLKYAIDNNVSLDYHTIEPFPIPADIYSVLNYPDFIELNYCKSLFLKMHTSPFRQRVIISPGFNFIKYKEKFENIDFGENIFDIIYFDAFSPGVQPQLWEISVFEKLFKMMAAEAILVTYSAKGTVRRNMLSAGFEVERIPGPKGKREILRARKNKQSQ